MSNWSDPTTDSVVNVAFEPVGDDETLMSIEHSLLPPEEFENFDRRLDAYVRSAGSGFCTGDDAVRAAEVAVDRRCDERHRQSPGRLVEESPKRDGRVGGPARALGARRKATT